MDGGKAVAFRGEVSRFPLAETGKLTDFKTVNHPQFEAVVYACVRVYVCFRVHVMLYAHLSIDFHKRAMVVERQTTGVRCRSRMKTRSTVCTV